MQIIYFYKGDFFHGDRGFGLIKYAAEKYILETGAYFNVSETKILREKQGKPYFYGNPVFFSLTHTRNLWMCMFSMAPCGIDAQYITDNNYKKIAERLFTEDENAYVDRYGKKGFFRIWTRREACGKMTGRGVFDNYIGGYLTDIETNEEDLFCSCCSEIDDEIIIRSLYGDGKEGI